MKLPFNLGSGMFGRRSKAADDVADDEAGMDDDDLPEEKRSRTVILDDPDDEDVATEPAGARGQDPRTADSAAELPDVGIDNLLAQLSDEELAKDNEPAPRRRSVGALLSIAAGVVGLLAIGLGGWWLAGLMQGGETEAARDGVPRFAADIPQQPPRGGGLNRLAAQEAAANGLMASPPAVQAADSAHPPLPSGPAAQSSVAQGANGPPPAGGPANMPSPALATAESKTGAPSPLVPSPLVPSPLVPSPAPALRSLNTIAATEDEPGAGIVVASIAPQAFSSLPLPPASSPLPPVPDAALIEDNPAGRLPKVDSKGRRPGQIYARPFEPRSEQAKWPRVAVVISGLGLSRAATEAAIRRTPGAVSLAFDPYGQGLDSWIPSVREAGHEFYVGLPLEPDTFPAEDPGPLGMLINLEPAEKRQRLDRLLGRMVGYTGVLGQMGGKYLTDEAQVMPMLTSLRLRGVLFVDASMQAKSVASAVATKIGLAHAVVGVVLDGETTGRHIDAQLARAETMAREQGQVVVMGRSSPRMLERLAAWTATIEDRRLLLAPVSALAKGHRDK